MAGPVVLCDCQLPKPVAPFELRAMNVFFLGFMGVVVGGALMILARHA